MTDTRTTRTAPAVPETARGTVEVLVRAMRPLYLVVPLYLAVIAYVGWAFVSASGEARAATSDTEFPRSLLGMPVLEGFAADGRFGVHIEWGVLVLAVAPAVIGVVMGVVTIVRARAVR